MSESANKYNSNHTVSGLDMATATGIAPRFSGAPDEDYANWQRLFSLFIQSKELNASSTRFYLISFLEGEAKKFYEYIQGDTLELEEVFIKFKSRFERIKTRAELLEEMYRLEKRSNETWMGFVERCSIIARKADIPEQNQVEWIVKRLPGKLKIMLSTLRLAAVDINIEGIRNVLNACQSRGLTFENIASIGTDVAAVKTSKRSKKKWCDTHKWCHHTTEKCRKLNEKSSHYTVHSLFNIKVCEPGKKILAKVTLPNQNTFLALVDTGAEISCIKDERAQDIPKSSLPPEQVRAFNGGVVLGNWSRPITFKVFDKDVTSRLLCFKAMAHEMILGMDILGPLMQNMSLNRIFGHQQIIDHDSRLKISPISISEELSKNWQCKLS